MKNRDKISSYKMDVSPLKLEEGGGYEALYSQLARSLVGYGETPQEAVGDLLASIDLYLQDVDESGEELPDPSPAFEWEEYSGRVTLRVPKSLHFRLDKLADRECVSLNSLMSGLLESAVTAAESSQAANRAPLRNQMRMVEELGALRNAVDRMAITMKQIDIPKEPA